MHSDRLTVRVAGPEDIPTIAILRSMWTDETPGAAFEDRMEEWLRSEGDRRTTWIAILPEGAAGMASLFEYRRMPRPGRLDSRWGYVSNMFVLEGLRNRGIGSELLAAIMGAADARGYARLVLSPSEAATGFYERAGFVLPKASPGSDPLLVRPGPQTRLTAS